MRRSDRLARLAGLAGLAGLAASRIVLAGCMVIYPDSELPDVQVEWFEGDCQPGRNLTLALIRVDTSERTELTVACAAYAATFVDVAREQYRFEAFLLDENGEAFGRTEDQLDLRDGFDERVSLYFGLLANFRVAWVFDEGATCASVGADAIELRFTSMTGVQELGPTALCPATPFFGTMPDGTYTLSLRAYDFATDTTVAISPESDELEIIDPELTNFGTLMLSPVRSTR